MIDQDKLKKAEEYVKNNIIDEYTLVHTQAVRKVAKTIADIEEGDKDVIDLAVLFHDIDRGKTGPLQHALQGAETTTKILTDIGFDKEFIEKVVHCVASHSTPWSKKGPEPETKEARIVYDADMVQQVSPFGIIKHLHEFGGKPFGELVETTSDTLINKVPVGIFTDTGKKMIKERLPYVEDFFARARE